MVEQIPDLGKLINDSLWKSLKETFSIVFKIPEVQMLFIGTITNLIIVFILTAFGVNKKYALMIIGIFDVIAIFIKYL